MNTNEPIFLGSKDSLDAFKRKHNIVDEDNENVSEESEKENRPNNSIILDKEHLTELDEETFNMLKRTRIVHKDYATVYMQSSLDFYDQFYHNTEIPQVVLDALNIRRVYKVYPDFLKAVEARQKYIEYIIEKHGGLNVVNRKMMMGGINEFMPPEPILSKKCPEYDLYVTNTFLEVEKGIDSEEFEKLFNTMSDSVADKTPVVTSDIVANKGFTDYYDDLLDVQSKKYGLTGRKQTVSFSDLNEIQRIFNSWYKEDKEETESRHPEYFRNAPENIRKRFYSKKSFNEPNLLYKYSIGEEPSQDEPLDPNEMVVDPVTNRSMPRKKANALEMARTFGQLDWSEKRLKDYKLIKSNIGKRRKKRISRKRGKRSSTEFLNSAFDASGMDPMYSDNESIAIDFMNLMKE